EAGPFPLLPSGTPLREQQFLVRLIRNQALADAVCGIGVDRDGAVVELEGQIKCSSTGCESEEAIGLHLAVPCLERQLVLPQEPIDGDVPLMAAPHGLDDGLGKTERVCQE